MNLGCTRMCDHSGYDHPCEQNYLLSVVLYPHHPVTIGRWRRCLVSTCKFIQIGHGRFILWLSVNWNALFCSILAGNAAVIKYEEKPPKPAFQNGSSASLYLKPLYPEVMRTFWKLLQRYGTSWWREEEDEAFQILGFRRLKCWTASCIPDFYLQKVWEIKL